MTAVGFTGSRAGMTTAQKQVVRGLFAAFFARVDTTHSWHNGDCIGSDAEAHDLLMVAKQSWSSGVATYGHPSNLTSQRAFRRFDIVHKTKPPLDRNKDIVDASDVVIATPDDLEKVRSGTWATIRYAKARGKHLFIVWPEGRIEEVSPHERLVD